MSDFEKRKAEIRKKVHQTSIYISTNLREEDKTRFMQFANSQFKGDYGIALRWLLDCTEGYFSNPNDILKDRIDLLVDEVSALKQQLKPKISEKKESKGIRTISGRKIKKPNLEE